MNEYYRFFNLDETATDEEIEARYPIETFMINSDNIAEYNNGGWQ